MTRSQEILSWIDDGIGWVSINRPEAGNAARPSSMKALCDALDAHIESRDVMAIVITGEGRHFLAGGDFGFLEDIASGRNTEAGQQIYQWFQGAARRLFRCAKPTLAAIAGGAITVGCELTLMCDVRIADRTAFFHESWIELGLIPPLGGAVMLPHIVGLPLAKEMMLESRRIDADEALRYGLINELVDDPQIMRARAQERAKAMAARPAATFARAKELIHRGLESSMDDEWAAGVAAQTDLLGSDMFREALTTKKRSLDKRR